MEHNNPKINLDLKEKFNLKNGDFPSNDVIPLISPVYDITENKIDFMFIEGNSGTLLSSTGREKKYFITRILITGAQDELSSATTNYVTMTPVVNNSAQNFHSNVGWQSNNTSQFDFGVKGLELKEDTAITCTKGTGIGFFYVWGYTK